MSLWERQKGEDKIIGQGATPSPCKQGWYRSTCLESKVKYLFLLGSQEQWHGNQDATPDQKTAMQRWFTPPLLSPSLEDNVGQGQETGLWACVNVVLSTLFTLHPPCPLVTHLCISLSIFFHPPSLFGSTSPFRESSSSCHKDPPFSPERRLPVPHCNPITYLTEECVISTE